LSGWNTPPTAASIAAAGYTHVMISFGVFSTTNPGTIVTTPVSGFDLASYISDLHSNGIQALLSIGGASTNVPNTTVNFHDAWTSIGAAQFDANIRASMDSLATTYNLDGFDFDIEQGFSPNATGATITTPGNDIPVLATIITSYRANHPRQLLTLVPQIANISATSGLNNTFGNYSSLIMQPGVSSALSWVGIQLYNAGCAFGIDCNCWDPNTLTTTPDPAVAFVEDLLQNWPSTCPLGQASGFLAYQGGLVDSQVALGFPVVDGQGISDGSPAAVLSVVKRAVQCLRTETSGSNSCDTYLPKQPYPNIGGVFSWNINNDASNGFQFSTGIYPCIVSGTCT
jgi:chitinase